MVEGADIEQQNIIVAFVAAASPRRSTVVVTAAKELHFNKNMEALKRMQAGADKLATVVGVTIGPKVS